MATHRSIMRRWVLNHLQNLPATTFDSERDIFPRLEEMGGAWLFDSDDKRLVYRKPNMRPLWKENLSYALRDLVIEGKIRSVGNRGGSNYEFD